MIVSKMSQLRPLISSRRGQHLTAYIANGQNVFHLKRELRQNLDLAYEYLAPVMSPEKLVRFLAPIHNLINDGQLLRNLKGNLGLFRNEESFRVMSIPVDIEPTCIVATSFHVKPLLRWMQIDRDFLLLGLEEGSATLYHGNQNSLTLVEKIALPDDNGEKKETSILRENSTWLNSWIKGITKLCQPALYVAGNKKMTTLFLETSTYPHLSPDLAWPSFSEEDALKMAQEIREKHRKIAKNQMDFTLLEFLQAQDHNQVSKNIFQIAKAAIKGRVKKLIIADRINIFGKLDRNSGGLSIHPVDLDNEDDDILDDLAQEVLSRGGEVLVLPRDEIPKGRPLLAIMEPREPELRRYDRKPSELKLTPERGTL